MKKGEVALSAFCVLVFSFMFYEALQLRTVGRLGETGSGFWPMVALGAAILLSLGWLIGGLTAALTRERTAMPPPAPEADPELWTRHRKVGLSAACLLLYILVMPWIGFLPATFVFVPVFALGLNERRPWVLAVSPVLVTAIVILVFAKFVAIPLPKGIGVFAGFSRLFY